MEFLLVLTNESFIICRDAIVHFIKVNLYGERSSAFGFNKVPRIFVTANYKLAFSGFTVFGRSAKAISLIYNNQSVDALFDKNDSI